MKALSVKNPWAHAILHLGKDVENRRWNTSFRGRIYLHVGQSLDKELVELFEHHGLISPGTTLPTGCIVGEVDIVDCVAYQPESSEYPHTSPWAQGPYLFVLQNAVAYEKPIPYRGALKFFDVELEKNL